ncbi:MAG: hypothetical protein Q8J76_04240 [Desulfobulbaceae bacterium]|nr:hypothetical protein [Desulfobulbaceae bacterium]
MPPIPIDTTDIARVYNAERNEWYNSFLAAFRPAAKYAAINISTATTHTIIAGVSKKKIRIVSLFFTVADEVNVTLYDGSSAISGPMDFGAAAEPRGIVIPFPYSPLELGEGNAFTITLSAAVQVSGTVCYYYQ